MAPKERVSKIAGDTCSGCERTRVEDGALICYGDLPAILIDEMGNNVSVRGAVVHQDDPACFAFFPKVH